MFVCAVVALCVFQEKDEGWWLVLGEQSKNSILAIRRYNIKRKHRVKLEFTAPDPGNHALVLYVMCDSYMGCDQEYTIDLRTTEAMADDE